MPFCSTAAQKPLRRPSEAVEVWVSSGRLWRSSGRPWESSGRLYIYSVLTVQCAHCAVCSLHSVLTVQCAHCTVCSLYSVLTVQCAHCTVCSLYSMLTVQCAQCMLLLRNAFFRYKKALAGMSLLRSVIVLVQKSPCRHVTVQKCFF